MLFSLLGNIKNSKNMSRGHVGIIKSRFSGIVIILLEGLRLPFVWTSIYIVS